MRQFLRCFIIPYLINLMGFAQIDAQCPSIYSSSTCYTISELNSLTPTRLPNPMTPNSLKRSLHVTNNLEGAAYSVKNTSHFTTYANSSSVLTTTSLYSSPTFSSIANPHLTSSYCSNTGSNQALYSDVYYRSPTNPHYQKSYDISSHYKLKGTSFMNGK